MKDPNVAWIIVKKRIKANFWKKVMTVKSITVADKIVVNAVARMLGPILTIAYFVRSPREISPCLCAYACEK